MLLPDGYALRYWTDDSVANAEPIVQIVEIVTEDGVQRVRFNGFNSRPLSEYLAHSSYTFVPLVPLTPELLLALNVLLYGESGTNLQMTMEQAHELVRKAITGGDE